MDQKETYKKIVEGMQLSKKSKEYKEDYLLGLVNKLSSEIKSNPDQSSLTEEEKNNLSRIKYELDPIGRNPIKEVKEFIINLLKDKYGRFKVTLLIAILIILSVFIRCDDYFIPRHAYAFINSSCKIQNNEFVINFKREPEKIKNNIFHLEINTPKPLIPGYKYYLTAKTKDSIFLKQIEFNDNREFIKDIEFDLKGSVDLNFILCNEKCNCNFLHSKTLSEFRKLSDQSRMIYSD